MATQEYNKLKKELSTQAKMMRQLNKMVPVSGKRTNLNVGGGREINVVYYKAKRKNAPLILGFHGGGFVLGGNAFDDAMWKAVCEELDCNVASIEYGKGPECQWQEGLDDCYEAACYLAEHAEKFGFDTEHMMVMGTSSGACMATTLILYAEIMGGVYFTDQILLYPPVDIATDPGEKGEGEIGDQMARVFNDLHCPKAEERTNPLVSPLYASEEELSCMPHTILCLAEFDNLRKEAEDYGEKLKAAGISVDQLVSKEMSHAFFELGFGTISEKQMENYSEKMRLQIQNGEIAKASGEALAFIKDHLNI